MGQLKENLQAIKTEKDKIDPNYVSSLLTVFGVKGKLTEISNTFNTVFESKMEVPNSGEISFISRQIGGDIVMRKENNISFKMTHPQLASAIGLTPEKLIQGQTILSVEGTAQPYVDPTTTQDYQDCLTLTQQILGTEVNS